LTIVVWATGIGLSRSKIKIDDDNRKAKSVR
jgi:hypothetical protein